MTPLNLETSATRRPGAGWFAAAVGLLALVLAGASARAQEAPAGEPPAPAVPEEVAAEPPAAPGESAPGEAPAPEPPAALEPPPAEGQPAEPPAEPPAEKPRSPFAGMTTEEILELPVFSRFVKVPWETRKTILADVKDHTFEYDEAAFYYMIAHVAQMPAEMVAPDEPVAYAQLMATPSSFRGERVTVKGVYVAVTPWRVPVIAVRKDVPYLYTCSIKEHPAEEFQPFATVVVLENPMTTLARGDDVAVTGYFYKVRQYFDAQNRKHLSPMIIAKRLETDPGGPVRPLIMGRGDNVELLLGAALGLLAVMLIAFLFIRRIGRSKTDANRGRLPHRIRLRRPDRPFPFEDLAGEGGPGGRPKPEGQPDH